MATSLRTNDLRFVFDGSYRATNDFGSKAAAFEHDWAIVLANGTGSGYANFAWQDQVTIVASGNTTFDLRALADEFGTTQLMARVKVIAIRLTSSSDTAATISVFGAASDPWAAPVGNVNDLVTVRYQGWMVLACLDATGYVTSGTSKVVKILNNSSTQSVTCDIVVVGEI
jgi:hypothetical protein